MNFLQPQAVKTVQSNEETDDTPTAAMTDEADKAVETAETTENVQETVKQPVEATADSEESVQNFTDDTVDNSDESDIIEEETNEWINRLSPEEIRAIKKYTKNSGDPKDDKFYARLNSMLRGDISEDDTLKYYSDVISGAIAKFELKHDIICYRSYMSLSNLSAHRLFHRERLKVITTS